jgi:fructuronate reductase
MPDSPQRIATDSSLKIPIRFGETIKAYMASGTLQTSALRFIPLTLAAWLRYLLGIDDTGAAFDISPDPQIGGITPHLAGITLGGAGPFHAALEPVLSDPKFFAVNLYEAGLGSRVEAYFEELIAGPGAVAATLKKYTAQ